MDTQTLAIASMLLNVILLIVGVITINNDRWREVRSLIPAGKKPPEIVIGVVVRDGQALIVHRKPLIGSRLHWQFPSGHAAAAMTPKERVVHEIRDETTIEARVVRELGQRRHPTTGKRCAYFLCEYVSGTAVNVDTAENIYVAWVGTGELDAYMGGRLFSKVKQAL